jgi:hypothetical protein
MQNKETVLSNLLAIAQGVNDHFNGLEVKLRSGAFYIDSTTQKEHNFIVCLFRPLLRDYYTHIVISIDTKTNTVKLNIEEHYDLITGECTTPDLLEATELALAEFQAIDFREVFRAQLEQARERAGQAENTYRILSDLSNDNNN